MLHVEDLEKAVGKIGWVSPVDPSKKHRQHGGDCFIAVKVVGVTFAWGKFLYRVEPVAGVGFWQVEHTRVFFDREELER